MLKLKLSLLDLNRVRLGLRVTLGYWLIAAQTLNMKIQWKGTGIHETGLLDGRTIVAVDPAYFRPTEVDSLSISFAPNRSHVRKAPAIDILL
jgi:GDP-D-mannose dehydratase